MFFLTKIKPKVVEHLRNNSPIWRYFIAQFGLSHQVRIVFKKIVLKCFRNAQQQEGINKLFLEYFTNCPWMTGQLVCKPYIAASLVPQLLPNYFSYVQLVEFFHKKSVSRSFLLIISEGSAKNHCN
mgnify:CR=1 FL=1